MRYFLEIAYNGTHYFGWQVQPNEMTVQEKIETALSTLLREKIAVTGAGRTDTGVHAKQLFAHFDFEQIDNLSKLKYRLNSFLPKDIAITSIFEVQPRAHARFDATARSYEYLISLEKNPFLEGFVHFVAQQPDLTKMNSAANMLLSYQDFQCFSRSKTDVKTYHCTITKAGWEQKDQLLVFTITANRFLRNMVRAIVGTLLEVGYHKLTLEDFKKIIESKDRNQAGASAPAQGLYLTQIVYPETIKN